MASVILEGIDALRIAKYIADCMGQEAYSLEPDFVMTARLYLPDDSAPFPPNWVQQIERWRDLNNMFAPWRNFRVMPDGPPYSMGGEPSVQGTLL